MSDSFDDFMKDVETHEKKGPSQRADRYKLQNGDNRFVLLSVPVGFTEVFKVGIAYDGSGYGGLGSRRYNAYIFDLKDDTVKMATFSHTVAKQINQLRISPRTAFATTPCPYVMNIVTENAGTMQIKTSVLACEDYELPQEALDEFNSFDSVEEVHNRMKIAQKKRVDNDPALQAIIKKMVDDYNAKKAGTPKEEIDTIDYDLEDPIYLDDNKNEDPA